MGYMRFFLYDPARVPSEPQLLVQAVVASPFHTNISYVFIVIQLLGYLRSRYLVERTILEVVAPN